MDSLGCLDQIERYVRDSINLPFCFFLMLVIFLSLAPPREANGKRAGEAMVVTVVMLSSCLEAQMLLCLRLQECMREMLRYLWHSTASALVKEYRYGEVMLMKRMSKYVDVWRKRV